MPRTNPLAYYENPQVTAVKSFIVHEQGVIIKLTKQYLNLLIKHKIDLENQQLIVAFLHSRTSN
jgi:hypothetical protein